MGIVNRYAKGLLSILDSQTQGDTPSSMGDVIAPTFDISEYLLASKGYEFKQTTSIFVALGQVVEAPVPAGEMWWLRSLHLEVMQREAIATTWRFAVYLNTPAGQWPLADSGAVTMGVIGNAFWINEFFDRPLVLKTGDSMATTCGHLAGVPILGVNATLTYTYDRMSA